MVDAANSTSNGCLMLFAVQVLITSSLFLAVSEQVERLLDVIWEV